MNAGNYKIGCLKMILQNNTINFLMSKKNHQCASVKCVIMYPTPTTFHVLTHAKKAKPPTVNPP